MRILKKLLLALVVIIVLMVIIAYFLPRNVHVERSLTMTASPEVIFDQVNTLKNWEKWSPWYGKDPNMKLTYEGPASGEGATYKWESDKRDVGNGSLKILKSMPYDSLVNEMNFMENGIAYSTFKLDKADKGTNVTWRMDSDMGMNPIARWMGLMMDKWVGPDFEKGLARIDSVSRLAPAKENTGTANDRIEAATIQARKVFTVRDSGATKDIPAMLGKMYGEIQAEMAKNNVLQDGPVFAIYHSFSPDRVTMEAGIPVVRLVTIDKKSRVRSWEMPAGNVVIGHHYGSYETTEKTHAAIDEYIKANNKTILGSPWEEYVTDPGAEKDTAKWYSRVYYPVQ
jgi:effector-binding domain-containing protein